MRPETFVPFVMDRARTAPGVTGVRTLAEAGDTKHPFGFAVTAGGRETRWQVTGQLADGEKHDQPAAEVAGDPAPWQDSPAQDGGEEWLAATIGRAESPAIARLTRWSEEGMSQAGVTAHFHNGARAYLRRI
jgi:hypothetical protein